VSQQFGGDRFLAFGDGIGIVEGAEEGTDSGSQVGAVRFVQGAWLEMLPKRQSQTACGIAQSACDHWLLTFANKVA
jgi:hypothetical protein